MPLLNIIGNINQIKNPDISYNIPFRAVGGIVETFVTGGISYTMHSYISGSGSFEILQGDVTAQVLIQAGGGKGANAANNASQAGNGGGAGFGSVNNIAFQKSTLYNVTSSYSVYVGRGASNTLGIASSSNIIKTYDFNYIPYNPTAYLVYGGGNGGDGYELGQEGGCGGGANGNGIQGGDGGASNVVSKIGLAGGGGSSANGGAADTNPGPNQHVGYGGSGSILPYYFGGPSGSYPVVYGGGGGGGTIGNGVTDTYGIGYATNGGGNGGSTASPSGSNGVQYTGGGGGGGYENSLAGIYFPGGAGGDGVVRIVYQTQF